MNPIYDLFYKHPEDEGMTYSEHLVRACCLGTKMMYGGLCLLVHGLIPGFHQRTGTRIINQLQEEIQLKKYVVEH